MSYCVKLCTSISVKVLFCTLAVLWNVYGDCENYATLKGHSGAVMELHYNTDGRCVLVENKQAIIMDTVDLLMHMFFSLSLCFFPSLLFSASTDKTVCVWDSETGERVKRLKGHTSFVNSCFPARRGPQLACTGSDDGTVKVNMILNVFLKYRSLTLSGISVCR